MSGKAMCIGSRTSAVGADMRVYAVSPPLEGNDYVVVSAVRAPFTGPETYIFGSDVDGTIEHWGELEGSFRGSLNHAQALRNAGYEIVEAS